MNSYQLIRYIKLQLQLFQARRAKYGALFTIRSGLVRFGSFIAYRLIEKYFLYKEMEMLYAQNPNYKYIFYLALFFGLWGLLDVGLGIFKFFSASSKVKN